MLDSSMTIWLHSRQSAVALEQAMHKGVADAFKLGLSTDKYLQNYYCMAHVNYATQ